MTRAEPSKTLLSSSFKQAYAKSECPELQHKLMDAVFTIISAYGNRNGLPEDACKQFFLELQKEAFENPDGLEELLGDIPSAAQRLWTSTKVLQGGARKRQELCSIINYMLRSDDPAVMKEVSTFVRAVNRLSVVRGVRDALKLSFPPSGELWRGGSLPDAYRSFYVPGIKYRVPMFLASSMDVSVANTFIYYAKEEGLSTVRWRILLDPRGARDMNWRCSHVNLVSKSYLGSAEAEYLFAPYSTFTVREVRWSANPTDGRSPHEITIEAAVDNQSEPEDLPLAPYA